MNKPRSFTGHEARRLLRRARTGTLATLNHEGGVPYASLINVATDIEGQPIILVSTLAWHTRNLMADARASVLVAEPPASGDVLTGTRVTVMGRFERLVEERLELRYLARHPESAMYAGFGDFSFWRLSPRLIHAVAGFGRIETLEAEEVFPAIPGFSELAASAVVHMNEDHLEACQRLAAGLGGHPGSKWTLRAIDPDGADLSDGKQVLRLEFPALVCDAATLRRTLADLSRGP